MGELIVVVVLVFVGVAGAFPVVAKAVKEHTIEETDEVVNEKHDAHFDEVKA
jgi:hypothetical protein